MSVRDSGAAVWGQARNAVPDTLGRRSYLGLLTLSTIAGVIFAGFTSTLSRGWVIESWWANLLYIIGFLLAVMVGGAIMGAAQNVGAALAGHALITGVTGIFLGPAIASAGDAAIGAFALAALIVIGFGAIGALVPKDMSAWGPVLFGALWMIIVGMLAFIVLGALGLQLSTSFSLMYWLILLLFCAFVAYDFNRAVRLPHTATNAVKVSASVFLDYVNIALAIIGLRR